MNRATVAALVLLFWCQPSFAQSRPAQKEKQTLAAMLLSRGYTEIPLALNAAGHFELRAKVNGQDARFVLDTGASSTCIGRDAAPRLKLNPIRTKGLAAGLGSANVSVSLVGLSALAIGPFEIGKCTVSVIDLSHVNAGLRAAGGAGVDGVLGADLLNKYFAVIDFKNAKLYLR